MAGRPKHSKSSDAAAAPRRSAPRRVSEGEIKRRQSIMAAARKLVARDGYENFTMQDLAAESGVALGTLYNYYQGKEDIVGASFEDRYTIFFNRTLAAAKGKGIDRIYFIVEALVAEVLADERYAREMYTKYPANSYSSAAYAFRTQVYRKVLGEMRDAGDLVDGVNLDFLASHLTSLFMLPMQAWSRNQLSANELVPYMRFIVCNTFHGLASPALRERLETMQRDLQRLVVPVRY